MYETRSHRRGNLLELENVTAVEVPDMLAEAKLYLRVDDTVEDELIRSLIKSAFQQLDGRSGILSSALATQKWRARFDGFPVGEIDIPLPPLQAIDKITYKDQTGQDVDFQDYAERRGSMPGVVYPKVAWPAVGDHPAPVTIEFTAGYSELPAPIKTAILMMVGHHYENRQDVVVGSSVNVMPQGSMDLIAPYRVWSFG